MEIILHFLDQAWEAGVRGFGSRAKNSRGLSFPRLILLQNRLFFEKS